MVGMMLEVVLGDPTDQTVDAIANAANRELLGGGGVDVAIHRQDGPAILAELRPERFPDGLPTGNAVATTAGDLPARWVPDTMGYPLGPRWRRSPFGRSERPLPPRFRPSSRALRLAR